MIECKSLKPLNDWLVIKAIIPEMVSDGGILLLDKFKEVPTEGEVVAAGPGIWEFGHFKPTVCKPGDKIRFEECAVVETDVLLNGVKVDLLKERHVLWKIKEK